MVLDAAEIEEDLVRDVTEVLTSLCARLYGRRWRGPGAGGIGRRGESGSGVNQTLTVNQACRFALDPAQV